MKLKEGIFHQPNKLRQRIAEARIPHNRPVRARIPSVNLARSTEGIEPRFCPVGRLQLLERLPKRRTASPNLDALEVIISGDERFAGKSQGLHDLIGVITCNGHIHLDLEQVVPCGAAV